MINDKLHILLRSKKTSEYEKTRLTLYFKEIREIFDTTDYETALHLLDKILSNLDDIPKVLQRFIIKKILPNLNRLTQFMDNPNIALPSNDIENYYRQTLPKAIKKIFKIPEGLTTYLKLKMENWTIKHGKNIQHPTT